MASWSVGTSRPEATTFTSPDWPHGGKPGATLYVKVSSSGGWRVLERGVPSTSSRLIECSLAEALRRIPPDMRDEALAAHDRAKNGARDEGRKWTNRYMRFRSESAEVDAQTSKQEVGSG